MFSYDKEVIEVGGRVGGREKKVSEFDNSG